VLRFCRRHLSYGNVVATLALFIALGGASYAALRIPANSVGSAQIKTGAVTLNKIAKSARASLKGAKGSKGAPGIAGQTGGQGPQGVPGTPGTPGSPGERGPSDAFSASFNTVAVPSAAGTPFRLAHLTLSTGAFVGYANASVRNVGSVSRDVTCGLGTPGIDGGGKTDAAGDIAVIHLEPGNAQELNLTAPTQLAASTDLTFDCLQTGMVSTGNSLQFDDIDIGAIQLGALH